MCCSLSFRGFGMQSSVPRGESLTSSAGRRGGEEKGYQTIDPVRVHRNVYESAQCSIASAKDQHTFIRRPSTAPATQTPPTPHTRWGRGSHISRRAGWWEILVPQLLRIGSRVSGLPASPSCEVHVRIRLENEYPRWTIDE